MSRFCETGTKCERCQVFHDTGFPFLDGLKDCANESGEDGGPRGDGKALAKTEEAPQALPEGIRSMTPEMLDFRKMKHVSFYEANHRFRVVALVFLKMLPVFTLVWTLPSCKKETGEPSGYSPGNLESNVGWEFRSEREFYRFLDQRLRDGAFEITVGEYLERLEQTLSEKHNVELRVIVSPQKVPMLPEALGRKVGSIVLPGMAEDIQTEDDLFKEVLQSISSNPVQFDKSTVYIRCFEDIYITERHIGK
jgi:hypothetical protein